MNWSFLSTQKISQVYYQNFYSQCYFCKIKHNTLICNNCLNGFSFNKSHCEKCKLPTETIIHLCGQCQQKPPQYKQLIAPLIYKDLAKALITSLKFSNQLHSCHPLCLILAQELIENYGNDDTSNWPDVIIPVPSHIERIRERGFCHMKKLSKCLSNYLPINIPVQFDLLLKTQYTSPQHELTKKQRSKLKANSFSCPSTVPKHIALFDDVVTTGATLDACITKLQEAGAIEIDVWSLTRTPPIKTTIEKQA